MRVQFPEMRFLVWSMWLITSAFKWCFHLIRCLWFNNSLEVHMKDWICDAMIVNSCTPCFVALEADFGLFYWLHLP